MKNKLHLRTLNIQNFATIENQSINFETGLNAIVGETGSGKSLILEALELIFGGRAKKQIIRKGASFASVEAIIKCQDKKTKDYLFELGHPFDDDEIVVKRVVYSTGKSQTYLNFQSTSLQILQALSKRFIDIVGQFENQKLLSSKYQLLLLDKYSKLEKENSNYQKQYEYYQNLKSEISGLKIKQNEQTLKIDYLKFQINELEDLNPSVEDEKKLIQDKNRLIDKQNRQETIAGVVSSLSESESSIISRLNQIIHQLEEVDSNELLSINEKIHEAYHQLEDVSFELSKEVDTSDDDNEDLQGIIDKLDLYQRLKRKFNLDTSELNNYLNNLKTELDEYLNLGEVIKNKENKLSILHQEITTLAEKIHNTRISNAKELSKTLTCHIQKLNMKGATLELVISRLEELTATGISDIKFMAETNPGNGIHQVKEIASGGELSRILLAFRQVISSTDSISIFLFDEIDTGIGGHTALAIGQALSDVAKASQVILITHLPQIAMFSTHLIQVTKSSQIDKSGKTVTNSIIEEITTKQGRNKAINQMNPTC